MGGFPVKENLQWNKHSALSRNVVPDSDQIYAAHNSLETNYENLRVSRKERLSFYCFYYHYCHYLFAYK